MSTEEIWQIEVVFKTADAVNICGTEYACKTTYDAWVDRLGDFDTTDLIEIVGITNTADRAPVKLGFLSSEVKSIRVLRMY